MVHTAHNQVPQDMVYRNEQQTCGAYGCDAIRFSMISLGSRLFDDAAAEPPSVCDVEDAVDAASEARGEAGTRSPGPDNTSSHITLVRDLSRAVPTLSAFFIQSILVDLFNASAA